MHDLSNESRRAPRGTRRLPLLRVVAFTSLLILAAPAAAMKEAPVPQDVLEWFESKAYEALGSDASEDVALEGFGDIPTGFPSFGAIIPIHVFDDAFAAGEKVEEPVWANDEWVAPLFNEGELVGTIVAWRNPELDGQVDFAYVNDDVALGRALLDLNEEALLVLDPPSNAFLALQDEQLVPLVSRGELEAGAVLELGAYQERLLERLANREGASPKDGIAGGIGAPLAMVQQPAVRMGLQMGGAVLLLGGLFLAFAERRRSRRSA